MGHRNPRRDFLYVDDMARASIHIMNLDKKIYNKHTTPMCRHINIGSGSDLSIKELAELIKEVIGYSGNIDFDPNKPDGTPRKFLDIDIIKNLNFKSTTGLKEGLIKTYKNYIKINANI